MKLKNCPGIGVPWEKRLKNPGRFDKPIKNVCVLNRDNHKKSNFYLYEEKDPQKLRDNNYRFIITKDAFSHTAFHTKEGLNEWLEDSGLKVGEKLGHLHNTKKLKGGYEEITVAVKDRKQFDKFCKSNHLRESKTLSNGDYTKSCIKKGKQGNQIFSINPNYDREVYPYEQK